MRIGIVTTTFENYGTRLQNLATIILLKKQYKKAKIETIVVSVGNSTLNFLSKIFGRAIISYLYIKLKFRGKINKNNKLLHYQAFFLKNDNLDEYSKINSRYDLIVVGSDQIWKHYYYLTNFKFALFANNKICNAPSFPIRDINEKTFSDLLPLVSTFKNLNFREQATVDYFNKHGVECNKLDDPTLRVEKNEWNSFVGKQKHFSNLIYILNDKKCFEDAVSQIGYHDTNKYIFLENKGRDKFKYSPLDFLSVLVNSDCVITNSFHGACFAKIFNKKLKIVDNKLNNRIDSRFDIFLSYEKLIK